MAITVNTFSAYPYGFSINATSADASDCEELVAAPAADYSIYLESLTISTAAALTVTIGCGEAANECEVVLIGPIVMGENQTLRWRFVRPIMCVAGKSLTVDASGGGVVTVFAEGFVDVSRIPV